MALTRPLRLKAEVFKRPEIQHASAHSVAHIWVDTGVYHLDSPFDYAIPLSLDSAVSVGVRVEVPFHGKLYEGLVISRSDGSTLGLKNISRVLSPIPIVDASTLTLIQSVAGRWASHPFDILRTAIPRRVASVEKDILQSPEKGGDRSQPSRQYLQLPPYKATLDALVEVIGDRHREGGTLVVVPESRLAQQLSDKFPEALLLDSSLVGSIRYRNFLLASAASNALVIGTRSAIFAPIFNLNNVIVVNEISEHHYEQRTPGWNVRDVAILRSQIQRISLTFLGYSPSSEVARMIENGWIAYLSKRQRIRVRNFQPTNGELLPGGIFSEVRSGLSQGAVLFVVPRKGYSQAIACSRCRNIARCECGGKLQKTSAHSDPSCALCGKNHPDWSCTWCQNKAPFLIGRGSLRFSQEIGAAFPGVKISSSEGENIIEEIANPSGIVIATPGSIPRTPSGYSRVVILESESFFFQSDIRAQERAREIFFSSAAHLSHNGTFVTTLDSSHPIIPALSSWKPSLPSQQELRERLSAKLPPYVRAISLDAESSEISNIARGFVAAQNDGRLSRECRILGPIASPRNSSRLVLLSPIDIADETIALIHEFQRRRSSSRKPLVSIRVDPYSLTR